MRTLVRDIQKNVGHTVTLMGWVFARRDHGKLIFIDLRDRSGVVQVVFPPDLAKGDAGTLRAAFVVKIEGLVKERPQNMVNEKMPHRLGYYEIEARTLHIINSAQPLPLSYDTDGKEINEEVRMKYRYLDLRRERMQKNIRMRGEVNSFLRNFLTAHDFTEIETPMLGKSTPEGARDYLVPSRVYEGKFYALPQSPQQYKQLLMVAGFERYFQIARCFRDEDTRGDRQPEFTQLDIEISFPTQEEILGMVEEMYIELVKKYFPEKHIQQIPFPRLTYREVMEKYNSDKPDLRKNNTEGDGGDPNELAFAFVVDFPMFEWKEAEKRWDAVHHPFTKMQNGEQFEDMKKNPENIFAHQYDVVLNGFEIGGGSLREENPDRLKAVFGFMGNAPEAVQEKFGHLLEAFQYGVPPHGGIALGLDRLYSILCNEPNIREVIAFPKTGDGRDLLMGAPDTVRDEQLKELHITLKNKK